jgi:hypothetical protein
MMNDVIVESDVEGEKTRSASTLSCAICPANLAQIVFDPRILSA